MHYKAMPIDPSSNSNPYVAVSFLFNHNTRKLIMDDYTIVLLSKDHITPTTKDHKLIWNADNIAEIFNIPTIS